MTWPGEIDADGWRMPKKHRALGVYYLAKAGLPPRAIAKVVGIKAASVKVMTYWMRNPRPTPHGYVFNKATKTAHRRHDFTGKYVGRQLYVPVSERERTAYNGSRYA
jgi:hypothetical protein